MRKMKTKGASWREQANPMVQASNALVLTHPNAMVLNIDEPPLAASANVTRPAGWCLGRCVLALLRCGGAVLTWYVFYNQTL